MSTGNLITDINAILNSEPEAMADLANQWQEVANAVRAETEPVTRVLDDLGVRWESQRFAVLTYGKQVTSGLTSLAAGAELVAKGLADVAPRLATIRGELWKALITLGVSVVTIPFGVGAVLKGATVAVKAIGAALGTTSVGADIIGVMDYVNAYNTQMAALSTALTAAEGEFAKLRGLSRTGGVVPAPPDLPATPDG